MNTISQTRINYRIFIFFVFASIGCIKSFAQTNPVAIQIPYAQDFGYNWFLLTNLPPEFAVWTSGGSPQTSNTMAASSTPNGNENGFDSATVVKSPGKTYGYSGLGIGGVPVSNGELYIQTKNTSTGTDQLILSVNTTGYSNIAISFDVEMLNPQPRNTGFVLQFRIGTTGSFTTLDSSYWHSSADRPQNQIDNFVNILFPSMADNQPEIQIRWATARDVSLSGASCGIGIDNIVVNGINMIDPLYFRSVNSGNWNNASTWESSADNISWTAATRYPNSGDKSVVIRNPNVVSTSGISNFVIDELTIDPGATFWNAYGTLLTINDGPGSIDLTVNGTFLDSSNYSIVWLNTSTWIMGPNGNLIKTTNSNSTNWQLKYYNGISNIPATSNWICRKPNGSAVEPSISTTNGGPPNPQVYYGNLYIENNSMTWNSFNLCKFSGSVNYPVVKGNLYVGGNGNSLLNFYVMNTNSSPVKVLGNINIKSGSTLSSIGTGVELQGNLNCDGNYTYVSSTSKLVFSGNNFQQINGSGTIDTYKLEINKSANDVTLNNTVNVFGNLNLLSGLVNSSSVNKISINPNATVTNASDISFVNGPVQKKGDQLFTFPVGKSGNYQPVSMNAGSGNNLTDVFTAEYFQNNPQNIFGNTLGTGIDHISKCEYWTLNQDNGNAQKNVTLTWDQNSCGVNNLSTLIVARYNSLLWVNEGNTGTTGNNSGGTITSSVTTGFGPFTLASATIENILPIRLLSFTAKYVDNVVKLDWVTASEVNNSYFTIERSSNAIDFENILTQPGAGNSTIIRTYSAIDKNPLPDISYYRLKQTDVDGKNIYSGIIPLKIKREEAVILSFNSSKQNSSIQFDISFPNEAKYLLEIIDMSGKLIRKINFSTQIQIRHFAIDMGNTKSGIYFLQITDGENALARKFIY